MGKHSRKVAYRSSAVALTVILLVLATTGVAAEAKRTPVPAILVGTWTRTITSRDVKRSGTADITKGSDWTLLVKKSGVAFVAGRGGLFQELIGGSFHGTLIVGSFQGTIVPAGSNRVHVNLGAHTTDVYTWSVSGRALTLTKVKDRDRDREAVFWGIWKRK